MDMAAASSQSVELDEQRAELKSVLESSHFVRAPKLARFLSYLCEKLFSGQAVQIKEYSIGVEVFGRGESFDQNMDSIVRVEANRLRKRLAEYYSGEGSSHRLKITIPIGQYVPEFEPGSAARGETEQLGALPLILGQRTAPADAPAAASDRRPFLAPGHRLWLISVTTTVIVLAAAFLFTYNRTHQRRAQPAPAARAGESAALPAGDSPFGPPPGDEVRILAGAARSFVDHAGKLWSADTWATGGEAVKGPAQHIFRTLDPDFYRASRQGQFRYDIPLQKGVYELRLHFAETTYGPESAGGEGSRIMTLRANGTTLLS